MTITVMLGAVVVAAMVFAVARQRRGQRHGQQPIELGVRSLGRR